LRSRSLLKRLALFVGLVLLVSLGLVGLALNAANYRSAVTALEARMEIYVYQALAAMEVDPEGRLSMDDDFTDPRLTQPGSGIYLRVRGERNEWASASALGLQWPEWDPAAPGEVEFAEPAERFPFFALTYGVGWQFEEQRIVPFTVLVLVDQEELLQQTSAFRLGLWSSLGAAAVILIAAQIIIFFVGLRPLRRVAADVARIESGQSPRLEGDYPVELEPLARNVNRLLDTEQSNQTRIRNALDSLAHSLKTPLAVLQAGLPLHGGDAERSMQNALDEMNRLIATRLERAGSTARRTLVQPVEVLPQLQRIVEALQKVYSRKMINAELNIEDRLAFYGEQRDLLELAGNLADNAFKYGESRVRVSGGAVSGERNRPGLWLAVEDDGPGIDESQWESLLQRGSRGDERVEGHGLGLAIVMELVTAYGGEVRIGHSELGGALVRVTFPPG
jgi:two-component system sensor histidine kinase PhoQ